MLNRSSVQKVICEEAYGMENKFGLKCASKSIYENNLQQAKVRKTCRNGVIRFMNEGIVFLGLEYMRLELTFVVD